MRRYKKKNFLLFFFSVREEGKISLIRKLTQAKLGF